MAIAVLAAVAVLFHTSYDFQLVSLSRIVNWVDVARASFWFSIGFYLIYVLGVMGLPVLLFPIIGGILFPFWAALPLNVFATTLGGYLSFLVTRFLGRSAIEPFLRGRIKSWDKFTNAQGFKTVLILRLVGVPPFIFTNYALGFSSVNHADFLTATMIGILPWMGIVTYLSHTFWNAVLVGGKKGLAGAVAQAMGPLAVVTLSIVTVIVVNYLIKRRRQQQAHSNL